MNRALISGFILISLVILNFQNALAADGDAIFANIEGEVQVLKAASPGTSEATMLYEGAKYNFSKAKLGQKISSGQVVMTSSTGKAKLIYAGGDVVIVSSGTFLALPTVDAKKSTKEAQLTYGKLRAVIDPKGPLAGLKIKTATAVAGVRGTDLYMSYDPSSALTKIETIRGNVQIADNTNKAVAEVKAGQVIDVPKVVQQETKPRLADQQELGKVQVDSSLSKEATAVKAASLEDQKKIELAQKKAQENIIEDIKRYDAEAGKKLESSRLASVDELNSSALFTVYKKAPPAQNAGKDDELYDKYFKPLGL